MQLSIRGLSLTLALVWGAALFLTGLANQMLPGYGSEFLGVMTMYPGYSPGGLGSVVLLTVWGLVDGALAGAVVAWLYNRLA